MGRPAKYSRRYHLTLEAADADLLDAYAHETRKPPATAGANLLVQALRSATSGVDELSAERRLVAELQAANATLRRRLQAAGGPAEAPRVPRWEWAIEDILADRGWWATWLPRLYELLGRQVRRSTLSRAAVHDRRGYADLLTFLFPPVRLNGRPAAEWGAPDYPHYARREAQTEHRAAVATASARPEVWEPVIRHVVVALCALERTAAPGSDPVLRIRTEDELTTSWLRTLRRLTGDEPAELPGGLP
jgi:hypothetical protein